MSLTQSILMRTFGRPRGLLGRLGGIIMARMNTDGSAWARDLLAIQPRDSVLEVGFGPGVVIERLSETVPSGYVAGVDPSPEMVEQARARNTNAIRSSRVDLRQGSVERLPFDSDRFDKALAINSMQVWPDAVTGLQEVWRVLKPGGRIALAFTPYSGQPNEGLTEKLIAAGFTNAHVVETDHGFCALATKQ